MPQYRIYTLDVETRRILHGANFEAIDDLAAGREAKRRLSEAPLEIWCGARKVASFEARETAP